MVKTELKLKRGAAGLFARLEAGEHLSGQELAKVRDGVNVLLGKIQQEMFARDGDEHRAWVRRQQAYIGRIVDALSDAHFDLINSKEQ